MKLSDADFLLLDCQTTGATPAKGNLLEVAWWHGNPLRREPDSIHSTLVGQPENAGVPVRIQKLTGISYQDMAYAIDERDLFARLCETVETAALKRAVIHYARFEEPFLRSLFERHGGKAFPLDIICTHQIARRLYPNLPARGIRGLAGYFGATTEELKRSPSHVRLTWIIWRELIGELAKNDISTLDDLEEWLRTPIKVKRASYQYIINDKMRLALPDCPGIYRMLNKSGSILYVGKATSLRSRVNSYFRGQKGRDQKKLEMLAQTWDISYLVCESPLAAALAETDEIKAHNPPYNINLKAGNRKLAFYSRDFGSCRSEQDESHPIGPFANELAMDSFIRLAQSLSNAAGDNDTCAGIQDSEPAHSRDLELAHSPDSVVMEPDTPEVGKESGLSTSFDRIVLDPLMFFDTISPQNLVDGFKIFCERFDVWPNALKKPRSVMAVALWLFRQEMRVLADEEAVDTFSEAPGDGEEAAARVGEFNSIVESDAEYADGEANGRGSTPEEVAEKFSRLLLRSARLYLRAKSLTRLLNVTIQFAQDDTTKTINVLGGRIVPSRSERPRGETNGWIGLGIDTYDRMSVLLTELFRLKTAELLVSVDPMTDSSYGAHSLSTTCGRSAGAPHGS